MSSVRFVKLCLSITLIAITIYTHLHVDNNTFCMHIRSYVPFFPAKLLLNPKWLIFSVTSLEQPWNNLLSFWCPLGLCRSMAFFLPMYWEYSSGFCIRSIFTIWYRWRLWMDQSVNGLLHVENSNSVFTSLYSLLFTSRGSKWQTLPSGIGHHSLGRSQATKIQ